MECMVQTFAQEEDGAITVDWVVLSAAAVAMAIAATDVINGGIDAMSSNLEAQLRTQQISDAFVVFTSNHFDLVYDSGVVDEADAEDLFNTANEMTNGEILTELEQYIVDITNGDITPDDPEYAEAIAVASVAYQRNIVDDAVIETYFTMDGYEDVVVETM